MKKILLIISVTILIFAVNAFGQSNKRKIVRPQSKNIFKGEIVGVEPSYHNRKARKKSTTKRKKNSYNLPEVDDEVLVAFRKKRGITHDPEFENWASRKKAKSKQLRRKNK